MAVVNSGYVKIYGRKLLSSSIWQEPLETKVVWMTLLAMADANGIVDCWTPGVAAASGVSLAKTREAIATLEAPDPDSRSIEDDGRRIRPLIVDGSRCIFVVNHEKYRGFQSAKQAATAERMRKYREKRTESVTGDTSDAECAPNSNSDTNSDTNTNSETEAIITPLALVVPTVAADSAPVKRKRPKVPISRAAWASYSAAFEERYGVAPVRNAPSSSKMAAFVKRVGAEEAPAIAAFFVAHNASWYVAKGHPVGALLNDAEKLHMEWSTNRKITAGDAREAARGDEMRAQSARVGVMLENMGVEDR